MEGNAAILGGFGVARSDADGRFSIPIAASLQGALRLEAWHDDLGRGELRYELRPGHGGVDGLVVELAERPGAIEGRVLLPAGVAPEDVTLGVLELDSDVRLENDGTYRLAPVPAGRVFVELRANRLRSELMRASRSEERSGVLPTWLVAQPRRELFVAAGETLEHDFDLRSPSGIRVDGSFDYGGVGPDPSRVTPAWWSRQPVRLLRADGESVCGTELMQDGSFLLFAPEPGTYTLHLLRIMEGGVRVDLTEDVVIGTEGLAWSYATDLGGLRVEPARGANLDARYVAVRCTGPGTREVRIASMRPDTVRGGRVFGALPTGPHAIMVGASRAEARVVLEATVVAGREGVVRLP